MKKTWLQVNFFQKATLLLLVFLTAICLNVTHSSAADYTAAPTLPLNGAWSSEYWLSDTNHEQWYKLVIPSDGKLTYKVMGYTYVRYALYNSDLSERPHSGYSEGYETSPDTDGYDVPLSKGIYYLKVYKGGSDIFGRPFRVSIEGVDDGFPGIDIHDPGKHIGVINLDDETVENSSVKKVFGSGA